MDKRVGLTADGVYQRYIACGGNARKTARSLGVHENVIRWHLRNRPAVSVRRIRVTTAAGTSPETAAAIEASVRDHLTSMGIAVAP